MYTDDVTYSEYLEKMNKTLSSLNSQFATVRAGRANPAVLDQIRVDYWGTPTPINQVATISSPDPRTLLVQPWDKSTPSDLGINPQNDGSNIRLNFPQLTEERRAELIKQIRKYTEGAKTAVRNVRRDAMEKFKKQQKASVITEDDLKGVEKDLQQMTDDYTKKIDEATAKKEKELSAI